MNLEGPSDPAALLFQPFHRSEQKLRAAFSHFRSVLQSFILATCTVFDPHPILLAACSCILVGAASASPRPPPPPPPPSDRRGMHRSSQSPLNQLLHISRHPLSLGLPSLRDIAAHFASHPTVRIPNFFAPFGVKPVESGQGRSFKN